jgi:hypothetical protein
MGFLISEEWLPTFPDNLALSSVILIGCRVARARPVQDARRANTNAQRYGLREYNRPKLANGSIFSRQARLMMTADGSAEKRATRKAEDCDWYLLATVYGEPGQPDYDHAKNRISWNRFVSAHLTDKRRAALREQGFPESELNPFTSQELTDLESAYARRCKPDSKTDLPQPTPPFEDCVYRQLKRGRSGDEVRPGWRVN